MTTRPSEIPVLDSTDANSVITTTAQQETGYSAGDPLGAEQLNWLFQRVGQWLEHLSEAHTKNVQIVSLTADANQRVSMVQWDASQGRMVALNDSGTSGPFHTDAGIIWSDGAASFADAPSGKFAIDPSGNVVFPDGVNGTSRTNFPYTTVTSVSATVDPNAVHYDAANDQFLASYGEKIDTIDPNASFSSTERRASGGTDLFLDFATSPGGFSVAVGTTATGSAAAVASSNATGTVWTDRVAAGSDPFFGAAYDAIRGIFLAYGDAGVFETSPDGATWSTLSTGQTWEWLDLVVDPLGNYVAIANDADGQHLARSTDGGATWSSVQISSYDMGSLSLNSRHVQIGHTPDHSWYVVGMGSDSAEDITVAVGFRF